MSRWSFDLAEVPPPEAAVEIGADRVAAAAVERRGRDAVVRAYAIEPLPDGAVVPSLTSSNIRDRSVVAAAVGRTLAHLGRPRRVGLVVPDPVAKVSLIRFEQVPARPQDLAQLIRWQVRKAAPFPIEDAQVSFDRAGEVSGGHEFIVSVAKRAIVEEYEQVLTSQGAQAGIVDLSTFNVINAVLAGGGAPAADWLLVNVASDWASIAIMRGHQLIFIRTRGADADGTLADLVHQTAMYYEDRLQGTGLGRALICGSPGDEVRRGLEQRLALAVDMVDVRQAATLTDRISAAPALLDSLAPLAGLLLRSAETAA
jgi:Tfp pilus assembly PilM family ATPase